ncbi:MAG: hypothetical protein JXR07_19980 [Reichenbachiella sp.]
MGIVQKEFVRRILKEEAERLKKYQGLQIKKLNLFKTGELFNDRDMNVSGGQNMDGKLSFTHTAHQRFLDIRRKVISSRNGQHSSSRFKIHNSYVFKQYYAIAKRLMFEMTDDVVQGIRKDLNIQSNG